MESCSNSQLLDLIETLAQLRSVLGRPSFVVSSSSAASCSSEQMEEEAGGDLRCWDELIPDALGLIFGKLSLHDVLTVVPGVCKSWAKAAAGPYCWQEINIEEWSRRCHPDHIDRMLQMLIIRSGGSLRKLTVSGIGLRDKTIFSFIAEHAVSLQTLRLPRSEITDLVLENIGWRISTVTFLDLSYCNKMGARGLAIIGNNCKMLSALCRNMHPINSMGKSSPEDEAHAIASTMPRIKRLEIAYQLINIESVLEILSSCPDLEFLDLRGCWNVGLGPQFFKEKYPKLTVLGPVVVDRYDGRINCDWDECSDFSDASDYLAWEFVAGEAGDYYDDDEEGSFDEMWDDERRLEELELRFYEGIEADAALYGWPPSP